MAVGEAGFRDFQINGECMVYIKGNGALGNHLTSEPLVYELGLTSEGIQVSPQFYHDLVNTSQHGDKVGVESRWKLASCEVEMDLIHFDKSVLRYCMVESTGGLLDFLNLENEDGDIGDYLSDGWVAPAGRFMGGGKELWESGCHYVTVGITSPVNGMAWRFPASFLTTPPLMYPLGVQASMVKLKWKVIPYLIPFQGTRPTSGLFSGQGRMRGELFGTTAYSQNGAIRFGSGYLVWDHLPLEHW